MAWKYKLDTSGIELRELINNKKISTSDKFCDALDRIGVCVEELNSKFTSEDKEAYEEEVEEILADIKELKREFVMRDESNKNSDKKLTVDFDGVMEKFYDLCDECRCWIGL